MAVSAVIFVLCCGLGYSDSFAFWQNDLSYEGESIYNYLQVSEDDRRVILSTNVLFGVQSLYMKDGGLTGMYYDYAMAAPLMIPDKKAEDMNVLILGMGTGTYATQCKNISVICQSRAWRSTIRSRRFPDNIFPAGRCQSDDL